MVLGQVIAFIAMLLWQELPACSPGVRANNAPPARFLKLLPRS
jgi:hypothetical protein